MPGPGPSRLLSFTFASYAVTQTDVTFKCQAHYVPFILSGNRWYGGDGVCSGLEQIIFREGYGAADRPPVQKAGRLAKAAG